MDIVRKLWKRKEFVGRSLTNWGLRALDVVSGRNSGDLRGKRIVVFVRAVSDIRIFKQAKALKNTGEFYTVFFTKVIDHDLMRSAFDEIHPLLSIKGVIKKIESLSRQAEILVIHVSSPYAGIPRKFIERCLPWPVIFDQYDSYIVNMGPDFKEDSSWHLYNLEQQIRDEKFCYENADGVISKSNEIDYVKTILDIKAPILIYRDYVLEDWVVNPQEYVRTEDDRPHLVFIGVVGKPVSEDVGYLLCFDLAHNLNRQKIHFHIYPSPLQTIVTREYEQLEKELHFFHYHQPKKPWEIQNEIARYDFGIYAGYNKDGTKTSKQKVRTGTGVKLSTYLESGIPIIVCKYDEYLTDLVVNENIGIVIEDDNSIVPIEMLERRKEFQDRVELFRKKFSCQENISRLIEFYYNIKKRFEL